MPEVLVDLDDGRGPRSAEEAVAEGPNDLPYFVSVARSAAEHVGWVQRFVLSYTPAPGRYLTDRDVWVLIGDESATPVSGNRCPVLRTHGERFLPPSRGPRGDPVLRAAELSQWGRNAVRAMWRNRPDVFPRRHHPSPGWLPLGMPAFRNVPAEVQPIETRPIDVGFRGSIGGGRRFAPKTVSRRQMAEALRRLPSAFVIDFVETGSFGASYSADPDEYVQSLLQTKICLAPRGGSVETFRVFEGALAGCIIVTEPLPPAWFYAGLPRIELATWADLPARLEWLRLSPVLMQRMAEAARRWALEVVAPQEIGRWAAQWLAEGRA